MLNELKEIYDEYQLFHSSYQIDNFIIGASSSVNHYARYKQATREVFARYKSLSDSYLKYIDLQLDLDELDNISSTERITQQRTLLKQYRVNSELEELTKKINEIKREFIQFINILFSYREGIKDKNIDILERELWVDAVLERALKDYTMSGQLSGKTVDFAHSLAATDRATVINLMQDKNALLEWYHEKETELLKIEIKEYPLVYNKLIIDVKEDIPGIEYVTNI